MNYLFSKLFYERYEWDLLVFCKQTSLAAIETLFIANFAG